MLVAMATRILLLSVSAGAGHVRAAQALERTAVETFSDVEVAHVDVMDLVPKLFRKAYAESYVRVVQEHPALWGFLYGRTDREEGQDSRTRRLRLAIERLNTRKLEGAIASHAPDHVICTHFLPAELLSRLIENGRLPKPVWVQVTDFDVHYLWIHPHMTGYFAASPEVAWRMRDRGVPVERIHVTGIPVMPVFRELPSREICAREIGIDPGETTLLMMAGGLGIGELPELAGRLLSLDRSFRIVALAGKNERLKNDLERLSREHGDRLLAVGFTTTIERFMAAGDLAISKPGGLTTSECLAAGLPMIVVSPIPGQEERNADFLLENVAALKAHDAAGLEFRVLELLDHPERLRAMREAARRIARPRAAEDVLAMVLGRRD
jgi:processive 1,2-diacylglycerol beta-glucosyltransferase